MVMAKVRYETVTIPETLDEFKEWTFSSGPSTGSDFIVFAKLYRKWLKEVIRPLTIAKFNRGHYYCSAILTDRHRFIYLSFSDVRHFPSEWMNNILIRTVNNITDFTGGPNHYTTMEHLSHDIQELYLFTSIHLNDHQKKDEQ